MTESSGERRWGRRLAWAGLAQAASSATNFALYVGLLWTADSTGFGRWVAVLAVYHLAIAVSRSLVVEPIVAAGRPSDQGSAFTWAWGRRRARTIGGSAGLGAAAVGLTVGADPLVVALVALALPLLVRQDALRGLAWAGGRPARSVALDGVWITVTGTAFAVVLAAGSGTPEGLLAAWVGGGLASALAGGPLVERAAGPDQAPSRAPATRSRRAADGALPSRRAADGALPSSGAASSSSSDGATSSDGAAGRRLEARLHARRRSQAILTTARNLLPIVVALVAGPAAAGLLKAAILPYTPILSLVAGLRMIVLPALQRAAEGPGADRLDGLVVRLLGRYLAAVGTAVLVTLAVVAGLGPRFGPEALPDRSVLAWGAAIALMTVASTLLADGIGFGRRPVPVVPWRLAEMALEWGLVFLVVGLSGPDSAVVGWAVGMALGALVWTSVGVWPRLAELGRVSAPSVGPGIGPVR